MTQATCSNSKDSFTVYAQPSRSGFFGLTELELFNRLNIEPYLRARTHPYLIMDFSTVRVWDIASLLWLTVALHYYRREQGLLFLLRLPAGNSSMSPSDRDALDRSADYLRRWRFDTALRNIDTDLSNILVPEQAHFFDSKEPHRFYLTSKAEIEPGLLQALISTSLVNIRNLGDPSFTGSVPISPHRISESVKEFQAARIGDILSAKCGIPKRKADIFSDHLITEALLNVQDHPDATVGMISISLMGRSPELIVSVVDNGASIPETIRDRYAADHPDDETVKKQGISSTYLRDSIPLQKRADMAHHATKPHVTRKTGEAALNAGMGLTYIKTDTVVTFGGKLTILTEGMQIKYRQDLESQPEYSDWNHAWRGNLLRISIPVRDK